MPIEMFPKSIINLWTLILYNKVTVFQTRKILVLQTWISSLAYTSAADILIMYEVQRIPWFYVTSDLSHWTICINHHIHKCNLSEEFLLESADNVKVYLSAILLQESEG